MKQKLEPQRIVIEQGRFDSHDFRKLYRIFRLTICPGMNEQAFEGYYRSEGLCYIDVTFYYSSPEEIAGFCAAAFYRTEAGGKPVTIARSATGFLQEHRGGAVSKLGLYKKYMAYKWKHPFERLVLTIYASNPFIYNMVCKYTGIVYPRVGKKVPAAVELLKNNILESNKMKRRERQPFVVRINFEVEKTTQLRRQVVESTNPHVRFFIEKTGLKPCLALLLIIPVSFRNITLCVWLMLWHYCTGKTAASQKYLMLHTEKYKNRLTCWLNHSAQTGYADSETL